MKTNRQDLRRNPPSTVVVRVRFVEGTDASDAWWLSHYQRASERVRDEHQQQRNH